jgi:hypothetical protein
VRVVKCGCFGLLSGFSGWGWGLDFSCCFYLPKKLLHDLLPPPLSACAAFRLGVVRSRVSRGKHHRNFAVTSTRKEGLVTDTFNSSGSNATLIHKEGTPPSFFAKKQKNDDSVRVEGVWVRARHRVVLRRHHHAHEPGRYLPAAGLERTPVEPPRDGLPRTSVRVQPSNRWGWGCTSRIQLRPIACESAW